MSPRRSDPRFVGRRAEDRGDPAPRHAKIDAELTAVMNHIEEHDPENFEEMFVLETPGADRISFGPCKRFFLQSGELIEQFDVFTFVHLDQFGHR